MARKRIRYRDVKTRSARKKLLAHSSKVPFVIHQTAPKDENQWHPAWKICQQSWKRVFSEYEYKMWDDDDLFTLVKDYYPEYLNLYKNYPLHICRVDIARFFILHRFGGIYADMDVYCFKNFHHLLKKVNVVEGNCEDEIMQNSMMASAPQQDIWIEAVKKSQSMTTVQDVLRREVNAEKRDRFKVGDLVRQLTGPKLLSDFSKEVNILPKKKFNPSHTSEDWEKTKGVYTKHIMTGKWADGRKINQNLKKESFRRRNIMKGVSSEFSEKLDIHIVSKEI